MSRHEVNDNDELAHPSNVSLSRSIHSSYQSSRVRKQRRRRHAESVPQPNIESWGPTAVAHDTTRLPPPQIVLSPPPQNGNSPPTEIALLPGGGVEIPTGFRFTEAHDRTHRHISEAEALEESRAFGGLGLGMFRGLKKIPAAIIRAGRGTWARQDAGSMPEEQQDLPLPVDEDVETYVTYNEDNEEEMEGRVQAEQLLREYIQRSRIRRDHAFGKAGDVRREHYIPAPQPVPVPGSRTPVQSAVGRSEAPPPSALEAEEMAEEREALARAQEHERTRRVYAADIVKPPSSYVSPASISQRAHRRTASAPLPSRVYSHWAAERDSFGRRLENRSDGGPASSTSPLTFTGLLRLIQQIRDMPWVGERIAADYIPGGLRPPVSEYTSMTGYTATGTGTSYVSPALPPPLGQSWYAPQDSVLVLPEGIQPPPGFIPYPDPYSSPPEAEADDRVLNGSSHTHIEMPVPVHYVDGESYQFVPAEASATGQSRIVVPTQQPDDGSRNGSYTSRGPRSP